MNFPIIEDRFEWINFTKTFLYFLNKPNDLECSDWLEYLMLNIEKYDYEFILTKKSKLIKLGGEWIKLLEKCEREYCFYRQHELERQWEKGNSLDVGLFTNIHNNIITEYMKLEYVGNDLTNDIRSISIWPESSNYVVFKIDVHKRPENFSNTRLVGKVPHHIIAAFINRDFSDKELCEMLKESCEEIYGELMTDEIRKQNAIVQKDLIKLLQYEVNNGKINKKQQSET